MPTQLGEGMTGCRTNPALPHLSAPSRLGEGPQPHIRRCPPASDDSMHQAGPASRPFVLATLRALRLDPGPYRRCPHGGRKPAKPLVANVLTEPHPSGMTNREAPQPGPCVCRVWAPRRKFALDPSAGGWKGTDAEEVRRRTHHVACDEQDACDYRRFAKRGNGYLTMGPGLPTWAGVGGRCRRGELLICGVSEPIPDPTAI
jgi:hypothetical protein